jgi:hypothetical protein
LDTHFNIRVVDFGLSKSFSKAKQSKSVSSNHMRLTRLCVS